jgi:HAE1 family hydrophobic/amphiphilic exporter-1
VVFIPIAFLGGMAGQWFKPFGLTIACSVLVSLFVSFSLDPMLSAYWPDQHGPLRTRWFISRWLGYFNLWFDRQAERYKSVIAWALDHRFSMIGLALATFIGALALPALGIIPAALVPIQDNSMFSIDLDVPPGSNLVYAKAKAQEVARIARKRPEVAYTYIAMGREGDVVDEGSVFVKLLPKAKRSRIQADVEADIRGEISKISGVTSSISGGWNPGEKAIQIQIKGQQAGELTRLAQQVANEMRQVPAPWTWTSTKGQKPELEVQVDRGLPARSASPWARWRRRCGPRLPASTSATGSIPPAKPATSPSASRPRRAAWWPIWSRCRWSARTGRPRRFRSGRWLASPRAWGRRASTTSIAIA